MQEKIKALLASSRQVILDAVLDNGGIVAANSDKPYHPKHVQHYRYVWPRDASYIIKAADTLGMTEIGDRFFQWALDRADGLHDEGLLYKEYYPHGVKRRQDLQPDQNGTVLWMIADHDASSPGSAQKFQELTALLAEGLCRIWNGRCFTRITEDLWEEWQAYPEFEENHSYTLAACIRGLRCAADMLEEERYHRVAKEMETALQKAYHAYIHRKSGHMADGRVDASVMGLLYPFEILHPDNPLLRESLTRIEERLANDGGVHRYEHDHYDSYQRNGVQMRRGAGAWPLLNFWMSICQQRVGNAEKALQYYQWVVGRTGPYLPEQVFSNPVQVSISPLVWSHAMFVLATKELGLLPLKDSPQRPEPQKG